MDQKCQPDQGPTIKDALGVDGYRTQGGFNEQIKWAADTLGDDIGAWPEIIEAIETAESGMRKKPSMGEMADPALKGLARRVNGQRRKQRQPVLSTSEIGILRMAGGFIDDMVDQTTPEIVLRSIQGQGPDVVSAVQRIIERERPEPSEEPSGIFGLWGVVSRLRRR